MPSLCPGEGLPLEAAYVAKARILATRFFPTVTPNPSLLNSPSEEPKPPFPFELGVTEGDISNILYSASPWKAPGPDGLPIGFLKTLGSPFRKILAVIGEASLRLSHFPAPFKTATVVVLPKPGKTPAQKELAGAWRPISLLNCMGKILETLIAKRLIEVVEDNGLLPEGQFGNRKGRSTEVAIRFLTVAVRTAWAWGGLASLLQLDLKGAFDTVHHMILLATLKALGTPQGVLNWLQSYLQDRKADLSFDGQTTSFIVFSGVP